MRKGNWVVEDLGRNVRSSSGVDLSKLNPNHRMEWAYNEVRKREIRWEVPIKFINVEVVCDSWKDASRVAILSSVGLY